MNLTQNIKVKPTSQNNRKKIRKQNWNTITDEFFLDNVLKFSRPNKWSKTKLNTTMAIYSKNTNFLPATISNREAHNQSQNSRTGQKKDLAQAHVKQMMNRTVLIQNQDYRTYNPQMARNNIPPRMDAKKKHSLVVPKQVLMVSILWILWFNIV